jgi:RNA recognition motif-containing protein
VEFESTEAADKAVATKNGTELSKRQIKVELVRDPADRPTRGTKEGQGADQKQDADKGQDDSGKRRRTRRFGGGNNNNNNNNNNNSNNKRRFARRGTAPEGKENTNRSSNTGGNNTKSAGNNTSNTSQGNQSKDNQNQKPKRTRRRNTRNSNQPQNPPKEKILSKTAIFVANIPFEAKDEDLKNFFKDSNPKSAHVVTTQTGRSRGYGFVDFDNEKDQQHAIQTKNKAKWNTPDKEPREISVSASHSQPKDETAQSKE